MRLDQIIVYCIVVFFFFLTPIILLISGEIEYTILNMVIIGLGYGLGVVALICVNNIGKELQNIAGVEKK